MKELEKDAMRNVVRGAKPPQQEIDAAKAALAAANDASYCPGGTNDPDMPPG